MWDEAHAHALTLAEAPEALYIPPFDHPTVWDGHASVMEECAAAMPEPDAIVVAVGGGGYFLGVMEGLKRVGWTQTQVWTAETIGADALAQSLQQKTWVTLPAITSIASSLGAKRVARPAYEAAQQDRVRAYTVTDAQALQACRSFLDDMGSLVEPACGAALAAVYPAHPWLESVQTVLILVCGGRGLRLADLLEGSEK